MRRLFASLFAVALLSVSAITLRAHASWKPASLEAGIAGDRLWVELRFDLPAYALGEPPESADEGAMEAMMRDDGRLRDVLGNLGATLPLLVTVEVDGRRLPLRLVERPVVDDFRPLPRDEAGKVAHPLMAAVRFDTRAPAGISTCRVRLDTLLGPAVARLRLAPDRLEFVSMGAGEWSDAVPFTGPPRSGYATAVDFGRRGFGHVIPEGWDHALFMLTLLLGAGTIRAALGRSLAFTLGHTATLALVWTGVVATPGPWIEVAIAASIALAAIIAWNPREVSPIPSLGVALTFGLLHGLGFAAAARIPTDEMAVAFGLLGFNLGVETAQLLLLALAGSALAITSRHPWHEARVRRPLVLLALLGGLWLLGDRLAG